MAHARCHSLGRRASLSAVFVHVVGAWGCDGPTGPGAQGGPDTTEVSLSVASDSTPDQQSAQHSARHSARPAVRLADYLAEYLNGHRTELTAEIPAPRATPEAEPGDAAGPPETRKAIGKHLGRFAITYYWIAHERDRRGRRNTRIYDLACEPIARVSGEFAARLAREGTGKLKDGRVVNVAGPCECEYSPCFFHLDDEKSRFGVGVLERPLSPFRSVAVDPSFVTIGKRLYIPELDGLAMPGTPPWGGFVHDGCVVADDRGGAVQGQQIDFFMVRRVYYQAFRRRHRLKQITVHDGGKYCREQHANTTPADRNAI
jgi:3D (Asp-Asp-Asp) domain-containing protein